MCLYPKQKPENKREITFELTFIKDNTKRLAKVCIAEVLSILDCRKKISSGYREETGGVKKKVTSLYHKKQICLILIFM